MKISEMTKILADIQEEKGDLEVALLLTRESENGEPEDWLSEVCAVDWWDNKNYPELKEKTVAVVY